MTYNALNQVDNLLQSHCHCMLMPQLKKPSTPVWHLHCIHVQCRCVQGKLLACTQMFGLILRHHYLALLRHLIIRISFIVLIYSLLPFPYNVLSGLLFLFCFVFCSANKAEKNNIDCNRIKSYSRYKCLHATCQYLLQYYWCNASATSTCSSNYSGLLSYTEKGKWSHYCYKWYDVR